MKRAAVALMLLVPALEPFNADEIMRNAVAANGRDLAAAPQFEYSERRQTPDGTKTYAVKLIEGSPYSQLIAVNDQPLSDQDREREEQKMQSTRASRQHESASERGQRLAEFVEQHDRNRVLLDQVIQAFQFARERDDRVDGFDAYVVRATPRPEYHPPNRVAAVLRGLESRFWVERNSFHWIKIEASVVRPVSIASFLVNVEPGTQFTLEQSPYAADTWVPKHFLMRTRGRILLLFNKRAQLDTTFFGYHRATP